MVDFTPFAQQYPEGTHFSDGVRVGPIYPASYSTGVVGGNFQTPILTDTPATSSAPGVKIGPEFIYSITPYQASNTALRTSSTIAASSWLNFTVTVPAQQIGAIDVTKICTSNALKLASSAPGYGVTTNAAGAGVLNNSFTTGFVFDVPRCVSVTSTAVNETITGTLTAYGLDMYGFPVASQINITFFAGAAIKSAIFPKAMKVLFGIYASNAAITNAAYAFGTSDVYGLPYRLSNTSLAEAMWDGTPIVDTTGLIAAQLAALTTGTLGKYIDSPVPYGVTNLNPASTVTASDVRGLVVLPGYSTTAAADPQSNYTNATNYYTAKTLVVKMYLPFANTTKPALYANPAPAGKTAGAMVLGSPYAGGPLCSPTNQPTTAIDLYGSPQFWYV